MNFCPVRQPVGLYAGKIESCVDLGGWFYTRFTCAKTVTHPGSYGSGVG